MKSTLGFGAIIFAILGFGMGLTDWALSNFFLEDLNWEGAMVDVQVAAWLLAHICYAIGIIMAAAAAMAPADKTNDPSSGGQF